MAAVVSASFPRLVGMGITLSVEHHGLQLIPPGSLCTLEKLEENRPLPRPHWQDCSRGDSIAIIGLAKPWANGKVGHPAIESASPVSPESTSGTDEYRTWSGPLFDSHVTLGSHQRVLAFRRRVANPWPA